MGKIVPFADLHRLGRGYVLASGTFDLLHIGHVYYLREAAKLGPLVVALTEGQYIIKPGRPVFTDQERIDFISELQSVYWCCLVPERTQVSTIRALKPSIYVKGEETRREGNADLELEMAEVRRHGGETRFTGRITRYSSGALLSGEYMRREVAEKPL